MDNNIIIGTDKVSWLYNNVEIKVVVNQAFFAYFLENNYICVECGNNYILENAYYFNLEGKLVFSYDLRNGVLVLENNRKLCVKDIVTVGFFPNKQRILLIVGKEDRMMRGYNLQGDILFQNKSLEGFKMMYFQENQDTIWVVCDGDVRHTDKFGRFRNNFNIDLNTGELIGNTIGY